MANIIYDEKRFLKPGEVCAIKLNSIKPFCFDRSSDFPGTDFITDDSKRIDSDEITFIKYLGNGFCIDLISDELLPVHLYNYFDIGSDEFDKLDELSQDEIDKLENYCYKNRKPKTIHDFKNSYEIYHHNPLVIDYSDAPFYTIDSEIANKFALQDLKLLKSKILTSKAAAQQNLVNELNEFKEAIEKRYSEENTQQRKI